MQRVGPHPAPHHGVALVDGDARRGKAVATDRDRGVRAQRRNGSEQAGHHRGQRGRRPPGPDEPLASHSLLPLPCLLRPSFPVSGRARDPDRPRAPRVVTPASTMSSREDPSVLIMAAGRGTRMRSRLPKVLHPLCGRPLLLWPVEAAREAGAERIVVVLGAGQPRRCGAVLPPDVEVAIQDPPAGTGDAVAAARATRSAAPSDVIVLSGDHPLLDAGFITALAERHAALGRGRDRHHPRARGPGPVRARSCAAPTATSSGSSRPRPRATRPPEELAIKEINAGTYAFAVEPLFEALAQVGTDNAQGEIYLGDVLPLLRAAGHRVVAHLTDDEAVGLGHQHARRPGRRCRQRRAAPDPRAAHARGRDDHRSRLDRDRRRRADRRGHDDRALQLPARPAPRSARGCTVGPMTTLIDCVLGDGRRGRALLPRRAARCSPAARSGPFTHIRPGTRLRRGRQGGRVRRDQELRHRRRAPRSPTSPTSATPTWARAPTSAPARSPPTTTAAHKHRTVIGKDVRTGVHTSLVAPVTVGDGAYTGAGSVITEDVPDGRARHRARPRRERRGLRRAGRRRPQGSEKTGEVDEGGTGVSDGAPMELLEAEPQLAARRDADAHERPDALRQAPDGVRRPRQPGARRTRSPSKLGHRARRRSS